ncbi:asparagine synthase (glutamine-hydrolyzing) [Actinokineospora globicatena]|uniref:asparagine synthase (glutamine-hydrolyzing) n=1 Tax=Actinokineospora globicatena TaxID=103729 RepID=UPI0020A56726|nr:asparagine synthase (glutamine-hydrolyzing) [Actinokineospora globicatena]MCP2302470.1 asparagine synthase (glutamine-hydrolyzing) [Actinokineospora globicatena]GLW75846.1 asparagine synthetase B [Actinokineospora globicatena]GLW82684.1 asparagine synthetase B [Actinokineospora globicatena]
MSGIAGWVDFARDVARERAIPTAMTDTLAGRGPEGAGLWCAERVALGHRRSGGEHLPVAVTDSSGAQAAVTYAGDVHNVPELRTRLGVAGTVGEVLLRAYQVWGPEFAEHVHGTYAIAVWDARREELLLVRDRMGVKPLFYAEIASGVLFGSEPKAILAHPDFQPEVDAVGLRDILSVARVPGQAFFSGMREVLPGGVVRIRRSGTSERRYWQLRIGEHTDSQEQTIATVRDLLEVAVAQHMSADQVPISLLSGGLDSSSLTALAAQVSADRGWGAVRSLAVNDQDPGAGAADGNEDHIYARLMADHVGADHSEISLSGLDLLDPALRARVLEAYDVPINKGDQYASLSLLFGVAREHAPLAFSGELGDDVFGGYNWNRLPQWVATSTFPWVEEGRPRFTGYDTIFDHGLLTTLDLGSHERDRHSAAVAELDAHSAIDDPTEARYREVTYLALTRHARVLFDRLDRLGMAAGLDIRVPFADPRLVEYTFNIPWAIKRFDGREKSLLRAAMNGLLPESVSMRVKTPYPNLRAGAYDQVLRERLADVVRAPDSLIAPLISSALKESVRTRGADALADGVSRAALETALQLESWLRGYGVRLAI